MAYIVTLYFYCTYCVLLVNDNKNVSRINKTTVEKNTESLFNGCSGRKLRLSTSLWHYQARYSLQLGNSFAEADM